MTMGDQDAEPLGGRLGRIETKLDDLQRAVVQLARVEERLATLFVRIEDVSREIGGVSARLSAVERTSDRRGVIFGWIDRVVLISIGSAITIMAKMSGLL